MDYAYSLNGSTAPLVKKYQVAASLIAGIVALTPGSSNAGVETSTTTSFANAVGVTLDAATYATAQVAGGTPEALVSLCIDPAAVYEALWSGGATEGTALDLQTVTTASTDGLTITTAAEWSSPTYDEGAVWGYAGANAGGGAPPMGVQLRAITSVSTTAGTVKVAFRNDTVVGDTFIRVPAWPLKAQTLTFTTALTQARADVAVATNTAEVRVIELVAHNIMRQGRTTSGVRFILNDQIFKDAT